MNLKKILFVPEKNRDGVFYKTQKNRFKGLVDRDFLSDEDISLIEATYVNLKILRLYSIESYLFHPENMQEYYEKINKPFNPRSYINALVNEKNNINKNLSLKIASIRQGYPYFKDQHNSPYKKRFTPDDENFAQTIVIAGYLDSDDPAIFLKAFSLKDNGKTLNERQNISPSQLAKTAWFQNQIENIIRTFK